MTQTHTAGPWKIGRSYHNTKNIKIISAGSTHIATVAHSGWGYDDTPQDAKEAEANAKLIAAAPELLAACKMALEEGDDFKAMEAIRAAIAKAEGRSV